MRHWLLQQFRNLPLLERAARCAVGCWFHKEQELCNGVQGAQGPDQIFLGGWFKYWQVARTLRRDGDRQGIRRLLFNSKPQLMALPTNAQGGNLSSSYLRKSNP
jgi:hypothetical protein